MITGNWGNWSLVFFCRTTCAFFEKFAYFMSVKTYFIFSSQLVIQLLDSYYKLSLSHWLQIFNSIVKPSWTYGIDLWCSTKPSYYHHLQTIQCEILKKVLCLPFYVPSKNIHQELKLPFICNLAISRYHLFHSILKDHEIP